MIASKVEVNPDLIKFKPLSRKKKVELRKSRVIAYIEAKPYMKRITTRELALIAELSPQNTWQLLNRMEKNREIVKHSLTPRTFAYTVPMPVHTVKTAEATQPMEARASTASTGGGTAQLATYAKDFAWSTNSDSLREFVAYMDGKELDLRRLEDR